MGKSSVIRKAAAAAAIAGLSSPALAADRFDLICNGTLSMSVQDDPQPRSWHLRFDLARMQYCEGDCFVTKPIADVQPNLITIETERTRRPNVRIHHIDRTTGELVDFDTTGGHWYDAKGTCVPAPFSGFPSLPSKF